LTVKKELGNVTMTELLYYLILKKATNSTLVLVEVNVSTKSGLTAEWFGGNVFSQIGLLAQRWSSRTPMGISMLDLSDLKRYLGSIKINLFELITTHSTR
jgi:hypothetical protein